MTTIMSKETLDILDEMQREDDNKKIENRAKRLANCQHIVLVYRNPMQGKAKINLYQCDLPECEFCSAKRGSKAKLQIEKADFEGGQVFMIDTEDVKLQNQIRKLGKDHYKCFPQDAESERCIIFYTAPKEIGESIEVTDSFVEQLDWTEIARKRTGKRTSGFLGKNKDEENRGTVKVKLAHVVAETSDITLVNVCTHETDKETATLDPHTQEELQEAMQERANLDAEKMRAKGISARIIYKTYHINLSCIDWLSHIRNKLEYNKQFLPKESYTQAEFYSN